MRVLSVPAAYLIGACALLLAAHGAHGGRPGPDALQAAAPPPASFAQCKACHSIDKGGPALVGPNLFGVVDAPGGARPGYAYSPAMKAAHVRWDRGKLDAYLADPGALVPGTRMAVPGIKDPAKRREIIDYLATLK